MREEYREANKGVGWVIGWVVIIVLLVAALGAGGWAIGVAVSGPKGQADGYAENNSSENWIKQQAKFEELHAEYESTLVRIDQFKIIADANPNDAIAQTNFNGQISHCTDVVADYNAATRSFLSEDWKSIDLPATLDPEDCVPAAK